MVPLTASRIDDEPVPVRDFGKVELKDTVDLAQPSCKTVGSLLLLSYRLRLTDSQTVEQFLHLLLRSATTDPDGQLVHRGDGTQTSSKPYDLLVEVGMLVPVGDPVDEPGDNNQDSYVLRTYAITPLGRLASKSRGPAFPKMTW